MNTYKSRLFTFTLVLLLVQASCGSTPPSATPAVSPLPMTATVPSATTVLATATAYMPLIMTETLSPTITPTAVPSPTPTLAFTPTPRPVPPFSHIFVILEENREFGSVVGNASMPVFNQWTSQYALLTQYFAVTHPSLPNYLALIGGDTFHITTDCTDCFVNAPSLPDEIEVSGRTWKTYQEDLPSPCFIGSTLTYAQKHDPFIYFDPIRLDKTRCQRSIVPLTQLTLDQKAGQLPDFAFIVPNICNDGHDCALDKVNAWLDQWVSPLIGLDPSSLIVITWDEGQGDHGCCGLNPDGTGGGRVATLLISSLVKSGFQDNTPYTHYSLLKTICTAWNLPVFGRAREDQMALIVAPWKR